MSRPSIKQVIPSFKVGKMQNFRIEGAGFTEDDGNGGVGPIVVDLEDANGVFQWAQATGHPPQLLDSGKLLVRAKAVRIKNASHGHGHATVGSGNLTITVTNGDGTLTMPIAMTVLYDESGDN